MISVRGTPKITCGAHHLFGFFFVVFWNFSIAKFGNVNGAAEITVGDSNREEKHVSDKNKRHGTDLGTKWPCATSSQI